MTAPGGNTPGTAGFLFASWPGQARPSTPQDPRIASRPGMELKYGLLQFHLGADLLELGLELLRFVLGDAFLDRLRRALDEVLRLLEAEPGDGADLLDHLDLLVADGGKHDGELGLLLDRRRGGARGARGDGDGGRGRDAPLLLEQLCQLGGFENGQRRKIVNDFGKIGHGLILGVRFERIGFKVVSLKPLRRFWRRPRRRGRALPPARSRAARASSQAPGSGPRAWRAVRRATARWRAP